MTNNKEVIITGIDEDLLTLQRYILNEIIAKVEQNRNDQGEFCQAEVVALYGLQGICDAMHDYLNPVEGLDPKDITKVYAFGQGLCSRLSNGEEVTEEDAEGQGCFTTVTFKTEKEFAAYEKALCDFEGWVECLNVKKVSTGDSKEEKYALAD